MSKRSIITSKQSKTLDEQIDRILNNAKTDEQFYHVKLSIHHEKDTTLKVEDPLINEMSVIKAYEDSYMPNVKLTITIPMKDYIRIMDHTEGLLCSIMMYKTTHTGTMRYGEKTIKRMYRALVLTPMDMAKQLPPYRLQTENENPNLDRISNQTYIECILQLVDKQMYDLRHAHFHGVFKNSSMTDLINYSLNAFGIEEKRIRDIDNKTVYTNAIIPPVKYFHNLYGYLHNDRGIYWKGLSYFVDNGCFYMYPAYEVQTAEKRVLHVYKSLIGNYTGLSCYHYYTNEDNLHVLCDSDIKIDKSGSMQVEELGNSSTVTSASALAQGNFFNLEGEDFTIQTNSLTYENTDNPAQVKNTLHNKYERATDNPYKHTSDIAMLSTMNIVFIWKFSDYTTITPGMKIKYHYDNKDGRYKSKIGIISNAATAFTRMPIIVSKDGLRNIFSCATIISARLEPDME